MNSSSPDYLQLNGALQVESALYALSIVESHPTEQKQLAESLKAYNDYQAGHPDSPIQFEISVNGPSITSLKENIMVGLEFLSSRAETIERRIASKALLEVLQEQ